MIKNYSTTDSIQVITSGSSPNVDWFVDWTDINANAVVDSGVLQGNIASATTTTIVNPLSSTGYTRQVNYISLMNNSSVNPVTITVQKNNGSSAVNLSTTVLLPNWKLAYQTGVGWQVFNDAGAATVATTLIAPIELSSVLSFSYGDVSPEFIAVIPANMIVYSIEMIINTPFNGASPTLSVGDPGNYARLMTTAENNPLVAGTYSSTPSLAYSTNTNTYLSIVPGAGCTQGNGTVTIRYQY